MTKRRGRSNLLMTFTTKEPLPEPSHIFEILGISNEKPSISIEIRSI